MTSHSRVLIVALLPTTLFGANLIPAEIARKQGLERAWYTQVQLDPARNELDHVRLFGDRLVTISTAGVVQLLDAATGTTVWTTRVGNPNYPTSGPSLDANHVAMVNGSTLYVLSATDGREVLHKRLGGAASSSPALAAEHVFVPLFSGRVEAIPFPTTKDPIPWYYSSTGRVFGQPGLAGESIVWSTDRGYLYNAAANTGGVRYRFQTTAPFVSPVAYRDQTIYALTATGYLYAIAELTGLQKWRYSSGAGAEFPPAVVGDRVYFSTDEPALYCVTTAGELQWIAPGVHQFVSAGTSHIFGAGELGALYVLDKETGSLVSKSQGQGDFFPVLNDQNNWLYVYSRDGLVQCFKEIGSAAPIAHNTLPAAAPADKPAAEQSADEAPADEAAMDEEAPADEPADDSNPDDSDPFGTGDEEPAGDDPVPAAGSDDPFGGGEAPAEEAPPADGGDPFAEPFN
jgi:outer membrane protein assembly factor BamB